MNTDLRPSGIEGLGDISWGTHFCLFYETKEDLLDFFIPFIKAGLEHDVFCLCVASEPLIAKETEHAMRQAFPDFDHYLAQGQIEITPYPDWYLKEGHFDEGRVLQGWIAKLNQALTKGFSGVRFAANIRLDTSDWESFANYEGKLEETLRDLRIEGLCAYNLNRYSAANMLDVIRHHQFTLARQDGVWAPLEGAKLKRAHEEVLKLNAELEQRVAERTAELASTNEQLRAEIAERERAEALLHAREQEFRTIVENAPDQIIRYDRNLNRNYVNPAVTKGYDLPKDTFIGKPIGSIVADARLVVDAEEVDAQKQKIRAVFDTGEPIEYEVTWPLPSGRRTFWARLFPEFDSNGRVTNVLGIARDITERKRSEEALRASEARLQAAIDAADIGLWDWDLVSGQIIWLGHHEELFGFAPGEFDGTYPGFEKRVHPEDLEELNKRVQRARDEGSEYVYEYRVIWPDGSVHWITGRGKFVYNERGPVRMYGAGLDVTKRKQIEEALRESEEKFSAAFRVSPIALVIATLDGRYVEMNQAFCDLLGYSREELLGKTAVDIGIFSAETRQEWAKAVERAGGVMTYVEFNFRLRNGISRTTLFSAETITLHGVPHRLSTILDITDRKRAEESLRISENNFRTLADKSLQGIAIGQGLNIVYVNSAHAAIYGYTIEELKSMSPEQLLGLVHPDDRAIAKERARKRMAGEELSPSVELRIVRKDDSTRWIQVFNNPIEYSGQPAILSMSIDITERKQAEEALRKSEQVLREAESLGHTGSWEQDLVTGEIFNTDENLRLFFGDDPSKGVPFEDYAQAVHPDDREFVMRRRAQLLEGGPGDIEYRVVWPDGSVHVIFGRATVVRDESGKPIRVYGTNADITERKRAEEEISQHAARMEVLAEISQALAEVGLDVQAVFNTIARYTAERIGDSCGIRLLSNDEQWLNLVAFHHPIPETAALLKPIYLTPMPANQEWFRQVLQTGQSLLLPVVTREQFESLLPVEFQLVAERYRLHSALVVPLRAEGQVIGTIALTRVEPHGSSYTPNDQVLLQELADRAGLTIQNARLFEQVEGARERLEALSRQLFEVQETERQALTTELHDRVGQNLTGLSINLQNMKALLSDEMAKTLATKFGDAQALVEDTTRQIRDIMAELHPPELEDYGLAVALETYAEQAASRGDLELIADLPDLVPLPSDVPIALFRAAQEAISNVLKHANATRLEVSLDERDGRIRLRVEDNGRGFESDAASPKEAQTWGLKIMRERIESIGGKVQIESELGEGTQVTFEIERRT